MLPSLDLRLTTEEKLELEIQTRQIETANLEALRSLCKSLWVLYYSQRKIIRTLVRHQIRPTDTQAGGSTDRRIY